MNSQFTIDSNIINSHFTKEFKRNKLHNAQQRLSYPIVVVVVIIIIFINTFIIIFIIIIIIIIIPSVLRYILRKHAPVIGSTSQTPNRRRTREQHKYLTNIQRGFGLYFGGWCTITRPATPEPIAVAP